MWTIFYECVLGWTRVHRSTVFCESKTISTESFGSACKDVAHLFTMYIFIIVTTILIHTFMPHKRIRCIMYAVCSKNLAVCFHLCHHFARVTSPMHYVNCLVYRALGLWAHTQIVSIELSAREVRCFSFSRHSEIPRTHTHTKMTIPIGYPIRS